MLKAVLYRIKDNPLLCNYGDRGECNK